MNSLIGGIWDNFVNSIREINPTTRYIILGVLLFCAMACFVMVLNKKDDKHEKEPIRWRYLIIGIIFLLIIVVFSVFTNGE